MEKRTVVSGVAQSFYDELAQQYDKFYPDWHAAVREEAAFLDGLLAEYGSDRTAGVLDCACGIGTQAIGLALLGYRVTASDISANEISEAEKRAKECGAELRFKQADFCMLSDAFDERFDVVIAMDNALPHMLTPELLEKAVHSIVGRMNSGGVFIASIRDYDRILEQKPAYSAPYIHKTEKGRRVLFQTWDWCGENYKFIQYIIEDEETTRINSFECEYRAVRRSELTKLLYAAGCREVRWRMPSETGFYQPVVTAVK